LEWDTGALTTGPEDEDKPNVQMFLPLLRVLGKGSFGKVSNILWNGASCPIILYMECIPSSLLCITLTHYCHFIPLPNTTGCFSPKT
jgi:hypothetical protein